ncbi:MAG TPA: Cof-type HAD-IIB family hydrolase [Candidatus Solibacter sp.]|nr:Cof-type HAD-IIB family hydrolase [Candidatus Solibacter sp.]
MTPPIRVLVTDIDGTLLNPSFRISEGDRSALHAAHQSGIEIILATGRRHDYAMPVAQELGIPVWMISSNGALIRSSAGETFYADRLPAATAGKLIRFTDEFRGNAVLTFDRSAQGALVLERTDELHHSIARWIQHNSAHIRYVVPLEDALTEDPIQAMYCGSVSRMEILQNRLKQADFLNEITVMRTQYDARDLCILDILNRDCSKGHALRRWADHHGIPREQIMAIGDNYNDLEMLEFAGLPVIMGNASEELKQNGWRVTASNAENGVAAALEQILGAGFRPQIQV